MSARSDQPAARPRRSRLRLLNPLKTSDEKRIQNRRKVLDQRLKALGKASRSTELPSDSRAFLLLALGRLEALLRSLPAGVRGQELTLSWLGGLLGALERQAQGLPPEVAPFATRLPTTVEEEQRRRQAMGLLQATGARLRRERDEILESLDEVEANLG